VPKRTIPRHSLLATTTASLVKETARPKRTSVVLSRAVVERLRNAAHVEGIGIAATVEGLIERHVDKLEAARRKPYPPRPRAKGRP